MPIKLSQRRRRIGIPISNKQASVAPPAAVQNLGRTRAPVTGAVVDTVNVAVAAAAPLTVTGVVPLKLNVGRSVAPEGLVAIAAVIATGPVKPPLGVTVMVAVLPVLVPGELIVTVPLLVNANVGGGTKAVTVTPTIVVCVMPPETPVTVTA